MDVDGTFFDTRTFLRWFAQKLLLFAKGLKVYNSNHPLEVSLLLHLPIAVDWHSVDMQYPIEIVRSTTTSHIFIATFLVNQSAYCARFFRLTISGSDQMLYYGVRRQISATNQYVNFSICCPGLSSISIQKIEFCAAMNIGGENTKRAAVTPRPMYAPAQASVNDDQVRECAPHVVQHEQQNDKESGWTRFVSLKELVAQMQEASMSASMSGICNVYKMAIDVDFLLNKEMKTATFLRIRVPKAANPRCNGTPPPHYVYYSIPPYESAADDRVRLHVAFPQESTQDHVQIESVEFTSNDNINEPTLCSDVTVEKAAQSDPSSKLLAVRSD